MNQIDDLFSEHLSGHSTEPEARVDELFRKRMKEQAFDAPFKNSLENHISVPSERARLLFEEELEKRRRPFIGWSTGRKFAAAASLVLLVGIGFYSLNQTKNTNSTNGLAYETIKPNNKVNVVTKAKTLSQALSFKEGNYDLLIPNETSKGQEVLTVENKTVNSTLNSDDTLPGQNAISQEDFNQKSTINELSPFEKVALNTEPLGNADDTFIEITPLETPVYTAFNEPLEIPSILDDNDIFRNVLFIEEDAENGLLTQLREDVKGLKKGQHLDFTKYGFKSLEEMALNEEGFIVTEARKIKNTINWIKTKIH